MLDLIARTENEIYAQSQLTRLVNKLYSALCSMNKVLRKLGYHGEETSRQLEIVRTTDMCGISNLSEKFRRDFELFLLLKSLTESMQYRFYDRMTPYRNSIE